MQQKNKKFLALLLSGSILSSIITLPKVTYAEENKTILEEVKSISNDEKSEMGKEEDSLIAFEEQKEKINEYHKEVLKKRQLELNEISLDKEKSLTESQKVENKSSVIKEVGTYEELVNEIQNGTSDIIKLKNDITTDSEEQLYIERAVIIEGNNKTINYASNIPTIYILNSNVTVKNLNIEGNSIKNNVIFYIGLWEEIKNIVVENINVALRERARNASIVSANYIDNLTIKNVEQISGTNYGLSNHIEVYSSKNVNITTNLNNSSVNGGKVYIELPKGYNNIIFTGNDYKYINELLTIIDINDNNYVKYTTENIALRKEESENNSYKSTSYAIKGKYDELVNEVNNKIKNLYNVFMNNKTIDSFFDYADTVSEVENCINGDSNIHKYVYTYAERDRMERAYKKYGENYFFNSRRSNGTLDKQLSTVSNTNCIVYMNAYHIDLDVLKALCANNNTITVLNRAGYPYILSIDNIEVLKKALNRNESLFLSLNTSTVIEDGALKIHFTMIDDDFVKDNNYKFDLNIKSFKEFRGRNMTLYGVDYDNNEVNLGKVKISDSGTLNLTTNPKYEYYLLREENSISRMPLRTDSSVKYTGEWNDGSDNIWTTESDSSIEYTFYGTGIRLNAFNRDDSGKVKVSLDGKQLDIVDLNPDRNINTIGYINGLNTVYSIYNLNKGFHTIKIESIIEDDEIIMLKGLEIEVEGESAFKRVEEDSEYVLKNGTWNTVSNNRYSGGTKIEATKAGDSIEFTFDGTAIRLLGNYDEYRFAKITLDGKSEIVSFYESYATWYDTDPQSIIYEKINLEPGKHTIKIEALEEGEFVYPWTGYINIDAFEIIGSPIKTEINKNIWKNENGKWYYYDGNGNKTIGWSLIDSQWYYFNNEGVMQTGWQSIDGIWYHFDNSGYMNQGWLNDGGTWYFLNESGAMLTGWQSIGGTWYHFNNSGCMSKGWLNDGGTWYFLNELGAMQTGWQSIGGTWYHFSNSGCMSKGWLNDGGTWYFLNESGAMQTGWKSIGGTWYYLYESGAMATNTIIDGWYINESGIGIPQ